MNKSSSPLLHLHLYLLHFFDNEQIFIFQKKKKEKKSILSKFFPKKKINQNFQFLEKIQKFQIFQKKIFFFQNFQFLRKIQVF